MSKTGNSEGTDGEPYKSLLVASVGVLVGVAGFFLVTLWRTETKFPTALAEFFAIIFGVSAVHFSYDLFIRRTWLKEAQKHVIVAVKAQWYRTSSLHKLGLERGFERLEGNEIRNRLARATEVKVIKTWFPENSVIEAGLKLALEGDAPVHLYLCKPDSKILEIRCHGADKPLADAQHKIYRAVELVHELRFPETNPRQNASVTLYDCWPGLPIIKCGPRFFVGFYFRGNISPMTPWLEVKEKSVLGDLLRQQFESIEKLVSDESKLNNPKNLSDWLNKNEKFKGNKGAITKK